MEGGEVSIENGIRESFLGLVVRRYTDIFTKLVNSLLGLATKFSLTYKNHETLFEF
jgi:hypothetical protein